MDPVSLKHWSIVVPLLSDSVLASAMVGPSAIGSEKGNWISSRSVPPAINACAIFSLSFRVGYPATMCVIIFMIWWLQCENPCLHGLNS